MAILTFLNQFISFGDSPSSKPPISFIKKTVTLKMMMISRCSFWSYGKRPKFKDTVNPMCSINDGIEDTEHFLLLCNSFTEHRFNLLAGVNDVLEAYRYSEAPDNNILQLLLYGNKSLPLEANRLIFNATMNYIFETERFD